MNFHISHLTGEQDGRSDARTIAKGDPLNPVTAAQVMEQFGGSARLAIVDKQSEAMINAVTEECVNK